MRAWFLQGEQGSEIETLGCLLRQWASRPENGPWCVESLPATPDLASLARTHKPDVLLLAEASCRSGCWLPELLAQGIGLVVASAPAHVENILPLAEQHVVQVLALPASIESIGAAVVSAGAAVRRQRAWQARIDQLQQRLNDRILIERAKGILVERLSIPEKEAYQRLRLQSRRQRRPIRDIAQCLLDAQPLLAAELNGLAEPSNHRYDPSSADRSRAQP